MKKLTDVEKLENMVKTLDMANDALADGFGPAHNSDKLYAAIPGVIEDKAIPGIINDEAYYAIIVEIGENGNKSRPVDWYSWSPSPKFLSGFGGYHNYDYDMLIKYNPWVKEVWDSIDKKLKAVFEKKLSCKN